MAQTQTETNVATRGSEVVFWYAVGIDYCHLLMKDVARPECMGQKTVDGLQTGFTLKPPSNCRVHTLVCLINHCY